ncbi:MAG: C40 family peptidase [Bacteriovoracaceae bacterium]
MIIRISFVLLLLAGCAEKQIDVKVLGPVKELQKKYAPDKRVAVFTIKTYQQGKTLVVVGEVEQPEAKEELLKELKKAYSDVIDSVRILPDETIGEKRWGIITVSVANMRSDPGEDAELGSQVLMGTIVRILKKKGGWLYVQSQDKYLGWTDPDQMVRVTGKEAEAWKNASKVFFTSIFGYVHQQLSESSFPVCDLSGGALLKKLGTSGSWVNVELADGRKGFVRKSAVIDEKLWGTKLIPVPENIERTGKFLMGVPYLWGGTSAKGVDCSGFTKTVFLLNGQMLNRDANQQAEQGEEIEPGKDFENLKKGDLLFYGRKEENGKPERIVHVGIYLGNKEYIHSSGRVQINSFDPNSPLYNEYNLKRFVRARRVITATPNITEVKLQ